MTAEQDYSRRPVELLEIKQPRCSLRFGTSPCTATGTPKCYNTYTTCKDRENYTPDGSITWRFTTPDAETAFKGIGEVDGEHIKTPAIPALVNTNTQPTRLNLGAARDGESPFGVRSELDAALQDLPWADQWGDYYRADRTDPTAGTFFAKLKARNEFYSGWAARLYRGYAGQVEGCRGIRWPGCLGITWPGSLGVTWPGSLGVTWPGSQGTAWTGDVSVALSAMQQSLYLPEQINGPNADGRVTLKAADPLQLADRRRSLFPRPTPIVLASNISNGATTIPVFAAEADLTDAFGNTTERYARIGDEIFAYTTATLVDAETGEYNLTGVTRGTLGTDHSTHDVDDPIQRVGRYENLQFWLVTRDLLLNHTPAGLDASYIDLDAWNAEGELYLGTFRATGTVPEPTSVTDLCGELSQQGLFSIWWDERLQTIPLLAVRPPSGTPVPLNDRQHILPGAVQVDAPKERLTRVEIYYNERSPLRGEDPGNYADRAIRGDTDVESAVAGGEVRTKTVYSRWIRESALAIQFTQRLIARYLQTPRYLTISVDAKDRSISVGTILEITTRTVTTTEGAAVPVLWQVIAANEIKPGQTVVYDCQTYTFIGRFGVYMADGSVTYDAATDVQREFGAWYADADGLMSDGTKGYQYQ